MAKAKGTTIVGAVKFLRRRREEALRELAATHHHYLDERIFPTSWYPEEDLLALIRAVARLIPLPEAKALEEMGRQTAREHLEGVYSHLRGSGDRSPLQIGRRAFALWASQHDTGKMSIEGTGRASCRAEIADFGHPSRELCGVVRGYLLESFRLSGAESPRGEQVACRCQGAPSCVIEIEWSEDQDDLPVSKTSV
jgi:hypothetical protein